MIKTIQHLSQIEGGRGSCTAQERQAAEYVAERLQASGIKDVRLETFMGAPSTYRPFALAFAVAILGTLLVWISASRWMFALAALLNLLGAWGMLLETDLASSWMQSVLPRAKSHNVIGCIPPAGEVKAKIVLCAHLDSHRTPIFYSSKGWQKLFSILVGAALVSMLLAAILYGFGVFFPLNWLRWLGLLAVGMQLFALCLCLHADFTSYSPGANDNASGVAVLLELATKLAQNPGNNSEVWLVFSGCEESGAGGMGAFLKTHAQSLGEETLYLILDQVGKGDLVYLKKDGLVIKHSTHSYAIDMAQRVRKTLPHLTIHEKTGIAYTDALAATRRGLPALTLVALPPSAAPESTHWHQMSDTVEHIDESALQAAYEFSLRLIELVDGSNA